MLSRTLLQFGRGLGKRHLSSVSLGPSEAGVRVLSLAAPPVNTLTWEVFDEIDAAMVEAESDDACRAIVITAEKPGVLVANFLCFKGGFLGRCHNCLGVAPFLSPLVQPVRSSGALQ